MEEHEYVYQLKPLIIPGAIFLVLYPLILIGINFFSSMSALELGILIGIYVVAGLGIIALWVIGRSKRITTDDEKIVFSSLIGEHVLEPKDIRRIVFYFDPKGQEIAQIRTGEDSYYVSEFYFPFPELMSDLEMFIQHHHVRSNLNLYEA